MLLVRQQIPVLLCALAIEAVWVTVAALGDLRLAIYQLWILTVCAFGAYITASVYITRNHTSIITIIIASAVFRLTLLPTTPSLSDDIYRYLWDGQVQLAGINPYSFAPSSEALFTLRDDQFSLINHKNIPTVYPPLAQMLFYLVAVINRSVLAMKIALLCCECVLAFALIYLLRITHLDTRRVVWYLWNPLAVLEIAGNGHIDVLGIMLTMVMMAAMLAGRRCIAALMLAGAILSKLIPLLAAPLLWREFGHGRHKNWRSWTKLEDRLPWMLLPTGIGAGYLLYADAGRAMFDGLLTYLAKWRFNDSIFSLVREGILLIQLEEGFADIAARTFCAMALITVCVASLVRITDPIKVGFFMIASFTLLSPTLHPWYLLWILPFLPFHPNPAWISLSGLILLAYKVLERYRLEGIWEEQGWIKWAEYAPFYFLLIAVPMFRDRSHSLMLRR